MRFSAVILMTLSLGIVSQAAAQSKFVTANVTMNLDLPASPTVGGVNNLKNTLTVVRYQSTTSSSLGSNIGSGSNFGGSTLKTGSGVTSFLFEVSPTLGLIVRGFKQASASSTSYDLHITNFSVSGNGPSVTIKLDGTGLGGSAATPSGNIEPVTNGTTFDATKHTTIFNAGTNVTTISSVNTTQVTKNLATSPLTYPGSGNGTVSVTETGKSGFNRTYDIRVTQPINSSLEVDRSAPVQYFDGKWYTFISTMNVQGSVVGTGSVTVEVKPALEVQAPDVGGTPVKIKGIVNDVVKLMAGDTPSAITRTVGTYTLAAAETTVTDAGAVGKTKQFYAVVPGP